jgi:hypothetical protein
MAKVPVYISFDYDHDDDLKVLLAGQAKHPDSPFEIIDHSIKEPSANWKENARARIKRSEQVIVICGEYTDTATGVSVEINLANEEGKPYFLLHGRKDKSAKKPTAAKGADKIYDWTWPNLKLLIAGGR